MTPADHDRLLQPLCEALGLDDVAKLRHTGLLNVGGLDLRLTFDAQTAPDRIQAQLDLGTTAAHEREWVWYRLLVSNHEWGANGTLGWSLPPGDNRAMLTAQHPFDARTMGVDVAEWLRQVVVCGQAHWRALPSRHALGALPSLATLRRVRRPVSRGPDHWVTWMQALCTRAGLDHQADLLAGSGTLRVDGVDMLLRRDAATPDRFEVHLDLGMERGRSREMLWQGLLWSNFVMGAKECLLFSVHPPHEALNKKETLESGIESTHGRSIFSTPPGSGVRDGRCARPGDTVPMAVPVSSRRTDTVERIPENAEVSILPKKPTFAQRWPRLCKVLRVAVTLMAFPFLHPATAIGARPGHRRAPGAYRFNASCSSSR